MTFVATDLDRTIIPNGKHRYDGTLLLFKEIVGKKKIKLIYVSGRNIEDVKKAILEYNLPYPKYAICMVGAKIYSFKNKKIKLNKTWHNSISSKRWDVFKVKEKLKDIKGIKIQPKKYQSNFKLSYYLYGRERLDKKKIIEIEKIVESVLKDFNFVYSIDYPVKRGLIDILPKKVSKIHALDYIVKKEKINVGDVICCGDSGNDLSILASRYKAIVVRNANIKIKNDLRKARKLKKLGKIYFAKNKKNLNGNYVSGIIQGLLKFKIIKEKDLNFMDFKST